jgi:hypothetical protein
MVMRSQNMSRKADHEAKLAYALAELREAGADDRLTRLKIRRKVEKEFGCGPATAYRIVTKAAQVLAGQSTGQWGGHREGAGRPPKPAE